MTPTTKEQAKDLVNRFAKLPEEGSLMWYLSFEIAKQCALIAVDFAMNSNHGGWVSGKLYYEELKQEIEKL